MQFGGGCLSQYSQQWENWGVDSSSRSQLLLEFLAAPTQLKQPQASPVQHPQALENVGYGQHGESCAMASVTQHQLLHRVGWLIIAGSGSTQLPGTGPDKIEAMMPFGSLQVRKVFQGFSPADRTACAASSAALTAALFNSCASCTCAMTADDAITAQLATAACARTA